MDNASVNTNAPASMGRTMGAPSNGPAHHSRPKRFKLKRIVIIASVALTGLILTLGGLLLYQSSTSASISGGQYQAVFFTNGQVYFGKLQTLNGGYMKLTDIFYLQAQTSSSETKNLQSTSNQSSSDVQLIKLGNEIHGPTDEMIINKDQILFFENLKKDGKVADSIAKYKTTIAK